MMLVPPEWRFLAKFIFVLVLMLASASTAAYLVRDHYTAIIAANELAANQAVQQQLLRNLTLQKKYIDTSQQAEAQHATDQLTINRLGNQLAGVRVHLPTSCNAVPGTGQAAADQNGTGGILSDRVDAAFAELQSGVGQLVQRCDQLNIDAIAANLRQE